MLKIAKNAGDRIRRVREENRLNQVSFSGLLGITQPHLSNLESGVRNPSQALLRLMAMTFRESFGWLVTGKK